MHEPRYYDLARYAGNGETIATRTTASPDDCAHYAMELAAAACESGDGTAVVTEHRHSRRTACPGTVPRYFDLSGCYRWDACQRAMEFTGDPEWWRQALAALQQSACAACAGSMG